MKTPACTALLALGFVTCIAAPPAAADAPLTESRVVELAAQDAPAVLAARSEARAAEHERSAAARARLPDLAVTASYARLSSLDERYRTLELPEPGGSRIGVVLPEILDRYSARAALVVPLSDPWLTLASIERAAGQAAAAKALEAQATQARVAYEARGAFLLYRRAQGARRIAASAFEIAVAQARDQAQRANAGTAPASSVLTFETARDAALARLRIAEADLAAADATVRTFLPATLNTAPLVTDDARSSPAALPAPGEPPALRAARTAVQAADARVDAETQAMLPHLSLVAGADVASPNARAFALDHATTVVTWDVTLQLEWSLSSLTTGRAKRDRAIAEREALAARAEQLRRQLDAERTSAAAARASAESRLAASDHAVATATKLAEVRRNELATGVATPLDVTNAEGERVRAALEREDAVLDLQLADARLAFAAGWIPGQGGK